MQNKLFIIILLVFSLVIAKNDKAYSSDIKNQQKVLKSIKSKLQKSRKEIRRLKNKESNLITKLKKTNENLTLLNNYLSELKTTEEILLISIDSLKSSLSNTIKNLHKRKDQLKKRVRNIYTKGRFDNLEIIFGSKSFSDFIRRNSFFKRIAANDRRLIESILKQQQKIEEEKKTVEEHLIEVTNIKSEKNSEQTVYNTQKKERKKLLRRVKGKKKNFLKLAKDLKQQQKEINKIIEILEDARRIAKASNKLKELDKFGNLAKLKGNLLWPLKGKIIKKYGTIIHPVYKSKTTNNGIDIRAKSGQAVKAIASGKVMHTGQMSSFGNFLLIAHGMGYYSLYANLGSFKVKKNSEVKMGQTIAKAGDTGSLNGTKLHFELRKNRKTLNPSKWLIRKGNR